MDSPKLSPEELQEQALDLIRDSALSEYFDQLAPRLDFSIEFAVERTDDKDIPVGTHKIGGWPDVAPDFVWPTWNSKPLTFIAQLDLSALWPFDPKQLLPAHGMLSFFSMLRPLEFEPDDFLMHGIIGSEPETWGAWRVIHTQGSSLLERRVIADEYRHMVYSSLRISNLWNSIQLPTWCEVLASDGLWEEDEFYEDIDEPYDDLHGELNVLSSHPHAFQLLGYAHYRQDDMRGDAAQFSGHEPSEMRLLAQFSSKGCGDLSFAGDGNGYFFIEKNELVAENFSRSYFGLQR